MLLKLFFIANFFIIWVCIIQIKKSIRHPHLPMTMPVFWFSIVLIVRAIVDIIKYLTDYSWNPLLLHDIWTQAFIFLPALWLMLMWEYIFQRKEKWLLLFLVEPFLISIMYWTNDYHQLMYNDIIVTQLNGMEILSRNHGPLRKIHVGLFFLVWNVNILWITWILIRRSKKGMIEGLVFLTVMILVQIVFFLNMDGLTLPVGTILLIAVMLVAIYFYRVLDILPIARQEMLDKLSQGVAVFNLKNEIVDINEKGKEYLSIDLLQKSAPINIDSLPNRIKSLLDWEDIHTAQKARISRAIQRFNSDGSDRHLEVRLNPLYSANEVVGKILTIDDISEEIEVQQKKEFYTKGLEKSKAELEKLNAIRSNFFSNVTHEFRTPLTLLVSPLERLVKDHPADDSFKRMHRNADRLLGLVNQLLDVDKLDKEKMKVNKTLVKAPSYFNRVLSAFSSLMEGKNIRYNMVIDVPDELVIDVDKMESILSNLISNAYKFTKDHGEISASVCTENNDVIIEVADNGKGMSPEEINQVFNRFFQSDVTHTSLGTGIGLSIVKQLSELMGGDVSCQSQLGKGSVFKVKIPFDNTTVNTTDIESDTSQIVSKESMPATREVKDLPLPMYEMEKPIILLIEDEEDMAQYIIELFESEYHIIWAENGKVGLEKASKLIPDVIISDIIMPEMDGMEFLSRIQKNKLTSHVPIIMLTAKGSDQSKINSFNSGADAYITKPFQTKELLAIVNQQLLKQKKRQSYFTQYALNDSLQNERIQNVSDLDKEFIRSAREHIENNLSDASWGVEELSKAVHMSRSQLHRKFKALYSSTPSEIIKQYRMAKALELLKSKNHTMGEIAMQSGFSSQSYFATQFKKKYGLSPTEYV